jgi:hypothetical protein
MNPYSPPGAPGLYPDADANYAAVPQASVSEGTVDLLRQTRPWVMLLGILGFIASGLLILVGVFLAGWAVLAPGAKPAQAAIGLVYVPVAFAYIYPAIKLWSYGTAISRLMASRASTDLEDALGQQKAFWKFSGIAAVVVLGLYGVGTAVLIAFGALAAAGLERLGP